VRPAALLVAGEDGVARRVYWWYSVRTGACGPVVVAVLADGVSAAASLVRRAGFKGLTRRNEVGPAPDWVIAVPTAHPGRVCWCPDDCTAPQNWEVSP
jgi:hypothetical protein